MSVCVVSGAQCVCQPDEGMWCPDVKALKAERDAAIAAAVLAEREACWQAIQDIDDGEAPEYRACQEAIRARTPSGGICGSTPTE